MGNSSRFLQGIAAAAVLINDKVHAGFLVCFHHPPNPETYGTTGSLKCVLDHFLCVRMQAGVGWAHQHRVSTTFLTRKN